MWLKIAGSVIVIGVGTVIGFSLASRLNERPRQIRQFISCLAALKTYIGYASLPLSDALLHCTKGVHGSLADFLNEVARILRTDGWMTPQQAINQALDNSPRQLAFENPELEILSILGANLGTSAREEQEKYLSVIQEQLRQIEEEAIIQRDRNVRMYRYLGVCGGLTIVILLV